MVDPSSNRVQYLLDKWKLHEKSIAEHKSAIDALKIELASLLGVGLSDHPPSAGSNGSSQTVRGNPIITGGPVASGTKGRKCLESISALGGRAIAKDVAEKMFGHDPDEVELRKIRSYFSSLSKTEHGYIERAGKWGFWKLTGKGKAAINS